MHTSLTKTIFAFTAVQYLLLFVATLLVSIYFRPSPDMHYSTIIDFGVVFDGLRQVNFASMKEATNVLPVLVSLPIYAMSLIGLWFSYKTWTELVWFTFLSQGILLLVAFGWMGLMALVVLLFSSQPIDAEVLGEHWPQIIANGISALIAFYLAYRGVKLRIKRPLPE